MFVLLPRGYRSLGGEFRLQAAGSPTQQIWFREVCLWHQWNPSYPYPSVYRALWLRLTAALRRHGLRRRQAIEHAAGAITDHTPDRIQRAPLLTTLGIFGRLAYRDLPVMDLIGREAMKESPFFDEIAADVKRTDVKEILEVRFGPGAAQEFQAALEEISDLERLSELLRLAGGCQRIDDIREALTAGAASR